MSEDPTEPARWIRPAFWVVPAIVLALGAGVFLDTRGGGGGNATTSSSTPTSPTFNFKLVKIAPVSATFADPSKLISPARPAAVAAEHLLNKLYTEGFLDRSNWTAGSYRNVWPLFGGGATAAAQKHAAVLTVGPSAGSGYEMIERAAGNLTVRVLLDAKNEPATMVATARFTAIATGTDGGKTALVSDGRYVLEVMAGGWRIVSFNVTRTDHPVTPRPGPSASSSEVPS